jgi:hypothetical protein
VRESKEKSNKVFSSALRRIKIRQRSRLQWIKLGDANTRLFHIRANARRRKNFIASLTVQNRTYTSHQDKAAQLFNHFSSIFGTKTDRTTAINWDHLQIQRHNLSHLDDHISEEEVRVAVVGAKSALNANHTASRTKLASHAQRANDVPVNFS